MEDSESVESNPIESVFRKMLDFTSKSTMKTDEKECEDDLNTIRKKTLRFSLEIEFVELLSNPYFLHSLATSPQNYFEDSRFLNFLKYLEYWRRPEYAACLE